MLLRNAGVIIKLNKCSFFPNLGLVLRAGKPEMADSTTEAIHQLQDPTTQTKPRSFPSLCNVFRRFVSNFSQRGRAAQQNFMYRATNVFLIVNRRSKTSSGALERLINDPTSFETTPSDRAVYRLHQCM